MLIGQSTFERAALRFLPVKYRPRISLRTVGTGQSTIRPTVGRRPEWGVLTHHALSAAR
jgi:hypothetical protein